MGSLIFWRLIHDKLAAHENTLILTKLVLVSDRALLWHPNAIYNISRFAAIGQTDIGEQLRAALTDGYAGDEEPSGIFHNMTVYVMF